MKGFLITIIVVLVLALLGWIAFSNSDSTATISIDKQEIKEDSEEAADKIQEASQNAVEETEEAFQGADEEIDELDREAAEPQPTP